MGRRGQKNAPTFHGNFVEQSGVGASLRLLVESQSVPYLLEPMVRSRRTSMFRSAQNLKSDPGSLKSRFIPSHANTPFSGHSN